MVKYEGRLTKTDFSCDTDYRCRSKRQLVAEASALIIDIAGDFRRDDEVEFIGDCIDFLVNYMEECLGYNVDFELSVEEDEEEYEDEEDDDD